MISILGKYILKIGFCFETALTFRISDIGIGLIPISILGSVERLRYAIPIKPLFLYRISSMAIGYYLSIGISLLDNLYSVSLNSLRSPRSHYWTALNAQCLDSSERLSHSSINNDRGLSIPMGIGL